MAPHSLGRRVMTLTAKGETEERVAQVLGMSLTQLRNFKQRNDINIFTSDWVMLRELEQELPVSAKYLTSYLPEVLGIKVRRYGGHGWRVIHRYEAAKAREHFAELERIRREWISTKEAAQRLGLKPGTLAKWMDHRAPSLSGVRRMKVPRRHGPWIWRYDPESLKETA